MIKQLTLGLFLAAALTACNQANTQTQTADSTAATAGAAAPIVNAADAAVMKFETETHDFGKIKKGEKVTYEFKYVNTGKSPLIIKDAYATCGCTTPEFDKEPIAPGKSSIIKVTFDSAGKSGLQDKIVTVIGNTVPAENRVHLTGEVLTDEKPAGTAKKK
ncbi:DUF1573 domain-containing protein [Mucilaginibacter terrae]|uniref:DUF1573 domain-containing protein n=1 Tax=Mucilaginibacter terrae TaxID=1955052 RepID=A0ABU3GS20_9SPHI|nr:DUF1573 domain-containing protein [Mucilaginibacter terrae]MDT3402573.1 hypothetical protein [Mucilaginibacter terrae]